MPPPENHGFCSRSWGATAVDGFPGIKQVAWFPRQMQQSLARRRQLLQVGKPDASHSWGATAVD
ncbi:MAG: hypothetical protein ACYT04_74775, partial [Nostoc sp.]